MEVIKKDNYFSIALKQAQEVKVFVDGVECVSLLIPYDSDLNCYLKREGAAIHYK